MQRLQQIKEQFGSENQTISTAANILTHGTFSIEAINKSINKRILSMFYSPGVGQCCMAIKDNQQKADTLTLRGRSIAIVSDGSMLNSQGKNFMPVMDWIITQIKYYSCLDCFPFVIRKSANLQSVIEDLSICYGTVLYLDSGLNQKLKKIPDDILLVQQEKIAKFTHKEITDCQGTAYILAYLLKMKVKGVAQEQIMMKGLQHRPILIHPKNDYDEYINLGDLKEQSLRIHEHYQGKIEVSLSTYNIEMLKKYFSLNNLKKLTRTPNLQCKTKSLCAIITDGTAILGFGDIGPKAGLPVMEGKSLLFRLLGEVQVVPICIKKRESIKETIEAILDLASYYRAINLEDFKAPQCFQIERCLSQKQLMPVFHDDQHGTAIVVLAAFINALKLSKREEKVKDCRVVINGAGAAGITIAKLLQRYGSKNIIICDRNGAIYESRKQNMNPQKISVAKITNKKQEKGSLEKMVENADVFIGVSAKGALKKEWVQKMNKDPIVFALANPDPEITEKDAKQAGCMIYGSGRSDFSNQINNSLVFPGIFKGIIKNELKAITDDMKIKSAIKIAQIAEKDLKIDYIIPDSLNKDVALNICDGFAQYK